MPALANPQHEQFVREYFDCFCATEAARRAGYAHKSAGQTGFKLLKKAEIQARLNELRKEAAKRFDLTEDRWLAEIQAIAFQNMGHYMRLTSDGEPYIDLTEATELQLAAISKLKVEDYLEGRGDDARDVRKVEVQLVGGKLSALVKLGEKFGWLEPEKDPNKEDPWAMLWAKALNQSAPDIVSTGKGKKAADGGNG